MPVGRPSKYEPGMGARLQAKMAEGYSLTAAAASIGVHRDTANAWAKQHPEFAEAMKLGKAGRLLKLEGDLLTAKDGPTVTSRIFALKCADASEWCDRQTIEHTGKDGKPIETRTQFEMGDAIAFAMRKALKSGKSGASA